MTAKTHKTFGGMTRAAQRLISDLSGRKIEDQRDYEVTNKKVDRILGELGSLWSNPSDASEADFLKGQVLSAWTKATS